MTTPTINGELNGVCCMLATGLRDWYRIEEHRDEVRYAAAQTLRNQYLYEYHLAGLGAPGREPEYDRKVVTNLLTGLGLPHDTDSQLKESSRILARLLDNDPTPFHQSTSGYPNLTPPPQSTVNAHWGVVEAFHNALRRVTFDWDNMLDRTTMERNLNQLVPLAAHIIRTERDGQTPDLKPILELCHRRR